MNALFARCFTAGCTIAVLAAAAVAQEPDAPTGEAFALLTRDRAAPHPLTAGASVSGDPSWPDRSLRDPLLRQEDASFRPPAFHFDLLFAGGDFEHRTAGSTLDGDTNAALFRFRFEGFSRAGIGGGVELEGLGTDDDLFAASGFGVTEATAGELFGYFAYRVQAQRFRMPVRLGLFGRVYTIDQSAVSEVETVSAGLKVAVQPEVNFVQTPRVQFGAFGQLAFGFGGSEVETSPATETFDTNTTTFGLDLGLRLRISIVSLAIAFVHRQESIDESDVTGGVFVQAVDTEFNGLGFGLGFAF